MPEVITSAIPDYSVFGRATKLQLNPSRVEDLKWTIPKKVSDVQVNATSTEGEPTPQQTNQDESNDLMEPCPMWFWSLTEKFK